MIQLVLIVFGLEIDKSLLFEKLYMGQALHECTHHGIIILVMIALLSVIFSAKPGSY